ncbi:hypothetical protein GCM10011499_24550 [Pelagibacterium lentulum]|uniref:Uncharacterized protein n=1 Tax=Pelagibacterium lentulum TaxID=2029865 RepID=A0A916RH10_9HYPH|nr:hypothetical protein GCM10011499_24550 [Pelagibacterium lentulum]
MDALGSGDFHEATRDFGTTAKASNAECPLSLLPCYNRTGHERPHVAVAAVLEAPQADRHGMELILAAFCFEPHTAAESGAFLRGRHLPFERRVLLSARHSLVFGRIAIS